MEAGLGPDGLPGGGGTAGTFQGTEAFGFVGRRAELAALEAAFERASVGGRQVVLVGGEPGVGKSRLVAEFAREVHAGRTNVLFGRCDEGRAMSSNELVSKILMMKGGDFEEIFSFTHVGLCKLFEDSYAAYDNEGAAKLIAAFRTFLAELAALQASLETEALPLRKISPKILEMSLNGWCRFTRFVELTWVNPCYHDRQKSNDPRINIDTDGAGPITERCARPCVGTGRMSQREPGGRCR